MPDTKALSILFVDSTEGRRKKLAAALTIAGFQVLSAESGAHALEICPNDTLVLLGRSFPDLSDVEFCSQLKSDAARKHIPVIKLGKSGAAEMADECISAVKAATIVGRIDVWARVVQAERELRAKNVEQEHTTRRRMDEVLRQTEERYHSLFENMVEGFFLAEIICDNAGKPVDFRYVDANPALEHLTGLKREQIIGKNARDVLPGIEDIWIETYGRVALTGEPSRVCSYAAPLNRYYETVTYSPQRGQFACLFNDISERKRTEEAISESELRFRSVFENSPDAMFLTVPDGKIVAANPAACAMFGMTQEEICSLGRSGLVVAGDPRHQSILDERRRDGRVTNLEGEFRRKNGEVFTGEVSSVMLPGDEGRAFVTVRDITDRRRADQALRRSEAELREAQRVAQMGGWSWDALEDKVTWSEETYRILGFDPDSTAPTFKEQKNLFTADSLQRLTKAMGLTVRTGDPYELDLQIVRRDDAKRWVTVRGRASRGPDGIVNSVHGTIQDVTHRVMAEQAVRDSESHFRHLANSMPQLVWVADSDGTVHYYNSQAALYEGSELGLDKNWQWKPVIHPDDLDATIAAWKAAVANEESYQFEHRLHMKNGSYRWHLSRAYRVRMMDGTDRWYGTATDIHDMKQAEDALRQSELRFRALAENVPQMVWVTTREANFQFLSSKWLRYTGTTVEQNCNGGWIRYVHPEDRERVAELWSRAIEKGENYEAEYRLRRADGEYRWHLSRAVVINDPVRGEQLWFGSSTDVEDQKRTQELLIRSEKVAALGRMAASLAHDINNPLAAVMNTIYLARHCESVPDEVKSYLELADDELKRVAHISRQALGFYREQAKPAAVSIKAITEEAVGMFAAKLKTKRVRATKQFRSDFEALAIGGELRQVISNLIANSVDAVSDDGKITVRVSGCRDPKTDASRARITVADNGHGIAPASRQHLFEPLFTTKGAVGTGLGLWVSKQLVEKHGGTIRLRSSAVGQRRGTTICILLPATPKAHAMDASA